MSAEQIIDEHDQPDSDAQNYINPPLREYNKSLFTRVKDGDLNQCQHNHAGYQCPFRATGTRKQSIDANNQPIWTWEGSQFCARHQTAQITNERRERLRIYNVAQWRDKIERQAEHPRIKSLREDIGILRMTLEAKLGAIKSEVELEMRSGQIIELIREIAKTIQIGHKIEKESGYLLDRSQAMVWIEEILEDISRNVGDDAKTQIIAKAMLESTNRFFPEPRIG